MSEALPPPGGPAPGSPAPGACPACGGGALRLILEQVAPVHTSKLLASRADALAYPCGRIRLELCEACGFMTNTAFDAPGHDYSASFEETQAFSPTFRAFASEMARDLVEAHDLVGRDVFEIGCGQGDFLRMLCDATGARGIAVDPSWRFETPAGIDPDRLTVERAFFERGRIDADYGLVVCRHTLEHIHDVSGFLAELRAALEPWPATPVFFEVPDTLRILREVAFWDVFYEHCSYFTPGSVARAFRAAGFRPVDVKLAFGDQYVLLTAVVDGGARVPLAAEETPQTVVEAAHAFETAVAAARDHWTARLADLRASGRTVVIWGAGSKGVGFLATLGVGAEIACAVDVNPAKHGMYMPGSGHEIVGPDRLSELQPDLVIVMNPSYLDEIRADLERLGVAAEAVAL
jgi:SAM-dependent methyltransferase